VGESGDDRQAKGEEGHEKAKQFKEDPEKMGRDKGKESREKEGRRTEHLSATSLVALQLRRIILFIGTTPPFLVFPRSSLISFVACFEYK